MRVAKIAGCISVGFAMGVGAMLFAARLAAQMQSVDEMNARFAISKVEHGYYSGSNSRESFRFLKDKQTGDCYIAHYGGTTPWQSMVKTDDNACTGF